MDFSGLKRSLQLTGLAKDMAMLGASQHRLNEAKAREHLIDRLGRLHGLPQKMAQILSLNELSSHDQTFTALTEHAATLPFAEVQAILQAELGQAPEAVFAWIDTEGISASLGQVHAAQLQSGGKVALKVQYPGIVAALETDLKALGWISAPVGGLKKGFDLAAYQSEMQTMLLQELDYQHEAEMLMAFSGLVQNLEAFEVPLFFSEASTERVLTMSWLNGGNFQAVQNWSVPQRQLLAEHILRFFLLSCFQWRLLHSDPHPGNYRFRLEAGEPLIGLLDFGCVKKLSPDFVLHLRQLIWTLIRGQGQSERLFELFLKLGFKELFLFPLREKLPALCQILFAPFLSAEPVLVSDLQMGEKVSALLGEDRWNFRFAGPATLLFFLRTYQGLLQYLKALDVPINWRLLFEQYVPEEVIQAKIENPFVGERSTLTPARFLYMHVKEAGEIKVKLQFKAELAGKLIDLVPEDIQETLPSRGIDLIAIQTKAAAEGFVPGELFELAENQRQFKVWLA